MVTRALQAQRPRAPQQQSSRAGSDSGDQPEPARLYAASPRHPMLPQVLAARGTSPLQVPLAPPLGVVVVAVAAAGAVPLAPVPLVAPV